MGKILSQLTSRNVRIILHYLICDFKTDLEKLITQKIRYSYSITLDQEKVVNSTKTIHKKVEPPLITTKVITVTKAIIILNTDKY